MGSRGDQSLLESTFEKTGREDLAARPRLCMLLGAEGVALVALGSGSARVGRSVQVLD